MNRRKFLHASACAASAIAAGCHAPSHDRESAAARPCAPAQWQKHGIVLEATEPWERGNVQNFTTRAEPLGGGAWRLWYSVSGDRSGYAVAYAEGVPGQPMKKV